MLKISEVEAGGDRSHIKLEGDVIGLYVTEVENYCEEVMGRGHHLVLDLAGVSFLDRDGVQLFRRLIENGVKLSNCTPFISELIGVGTS